MDTRASASSDAYGTQVWKKNYLIQQIQLTLRLTSDHPNLSGNMPQGDLWSFIFVRIDTSRFFQKMGCFVRIWLQVFSKISQNLSGSVPRFLVVLPGVLTVTLIYWVVVFKKINFRMFETFLYKLFNNKEWDAGQAEDPDCSRRVSEANRVAKFKQWVTSSKIQG